MAIVAGVGVGVTDLAEDPAKNCNGQYRSHRLLPHLSASCIDPRTSPPAFRALTLRRPGGRYGRRLANSGLGAASVRVPDLRGEEFEEACPCASAGRLNKSGEPQGRGGKGGELVHQPAPWLRFMNARLCFSMTPKPLGSTANSNSGFSLGCPPWFRMRSMMTDGFFCTCSSKLLRVRIT
jgi:hypothetical protein